MDAPRSKRMGVARFSGEGATSAKPGTARWYKQHMPDKFMAVKETVKTSGNFADRDSEIIASRVLRWGEMQHDHHENASLPRFKQLAR